MMLQNRLEKKQFLILIFKHIFFVQYFDFLIK